MKSRITCIVFLFTIPAYGQINIIKKIEKKTEQKIDRKIDKQIDKGLDDVMEGGHKQEKPESNPAPESGESRPTGNQAEPAGQSQDMIVYGKYDFVQGDKIIFEDDQASELPGEFPSKWKLVKGGAENVAVGGLPAVAFIQGSSIVSPLMSKRDFLPEIFTMEFDMYFYKEGNEAYRLNFGTREIMDIRMRKISYSSFSGSVRREAGKGWHHLAIAVNGKKMKVYFNEQRVLNIPDIGDPLVSLEISAFSPGAAKEKPAAIRAVRIAEGGMPLYKRIMTDGKYVTRGILFDVGKSSLQPTSMGPINEMVGLMKEHPEMKFSIEGHTDSDGDDAFNQKLSVDRALAVKDQMVQMGVDVSRLANKGFGASRPVSDNNTPEGKANNRRVEFVKM